MIWNIISRSEHTVALPHRLTRETMYVFMDQVVDNGDARYSRVRFDLTPLTFIDPTGVVILSNLIDFLKRIGVRVTVRVGHPPYSRGVVYLDDFGFFKYYGDKPLRPDATLRPTTVPLERVQSERIFSYLGNTLIPWIADRVGLEQDSVAAVRVCFEEIFHNITDHSGVQIGCAFAQFFPKNDHIQVAISDYGEGIPVVVRRKLPNLSDDDALLKACEEGFSTKENVRNRGAGLPTLMRYVTLRNRGTVILASGKAELAASHQNGTTNIRARYARDGMYPGTLVKVILRTDTFEALEEDVMPETFKW